MKISRARLRHKRCQILVTKMIISLYLLSRKRARWKDRKAVKSEKLWKASDNHHHGFSSVPLILSSFISQWGEICQDCCTFSYIPDEWPFTVMTGKFCSSWRLWQRHMHHMGIGIHKMFTQYTEFTMHASCSLLMAGAYSPPSPWAIMAHYHTNSLTADCSDSPGSGETSWSLTVLYTVVCTGALFAGLRHCWMVWPKEW